MGRKKVAPDLRGHNPKLTPSEKEALIRQELENDKPPGVVAGDGFNPSLGAVTEDKLDRQSINVTRAAIGRRFPMTERVRIGVVRQLHKFLHDKSETTNDRIAAGRALIQADAVNVREEIAQIEPPAPPPPNQVNILIRNELNQALERVRDSPAVIEQLYATARVDSSESGVDGDSVQPGPLAAPSAPRNGRSGASQTDPPGSNGKHSGH